ncbi:MAG: glycosyltransferase [Planctomycetota bacterium]|jgi:glycosyltransferase involved in cell wall biosynthesis
MKIAICCKLSNKAAYGFIKPLADIRKIEKIQVFRDTKAADGVKIRYYTCETVRPALLRQIYKFFQMLFAVPSDTSAVIGIYEIPHGLLAFLIGKIKRIPAVICIISNPGYEKVRKGLRKFLMYFMLKKTETVTVTGSKAKNILINNGVDPGKICFLPNSIDIHKFSPQKREKKYDILGLSYFGPEKKLENFLYIVDILKKEVPTIRAGIAGKGPEKEKLQKIIKKLSLENNVDLLGFVDNTADCYNSTKVFVLTSETEGLPRTLIEAMACGVPCVASLVGDIEDLIINNENGFLVNDYSNVEEFAKKIMILLSDRTKYELFSKRALEFSRKNYSHEAATKAWMNILKQMHGANNG